MNNITKNINYFSFYNIEIDQDNDYLNKLNECVCYIKNSYIEGINDFNFPKDKVDKICKEIDKTYIKVKKAFNYSLSGKYDCAIKIIRNLILNLSEILIRPLNRTQALYLNKNDDIYLYKGRIVDTPYSDYSYDDMHIIPSSKRELTSTQRYSIPGVPCLYLSSNSFILWNELGRPRFENLCVSCFKILDKEMKVLDLSFGYQSIFREIVENYLNYEKVPFVFKDTKGNIIKDFADIRFSDFLENVNDEKYIMLSSIYPLLAAVSIHCKEKNRKFKSEYVISQLIMHCLRECKGILYRSSAMDGKYGLPSINLAIPNLQFDKNYKNNLYGDIGKLVEITDSFNFQYFIDNCSDIYYKYKTREYNVVEIYQLPSKSTFNKMLDKFSGSNTYDLNFIYKGSMYYFFDEFLISKTFNKI